MSDNTTIARPYAKAIFQIAFEEKALGSWSDILQILMQVVADPAAQAFIRNPSTTQALHCDLILSFVDTKKYANFMPRIENLVRLLAQNKRLLLLPEIKQRFEILRADQEKTLKVYVKSFSMLNHDEEQKLVTRLSQRLQRQVTLDVSVEPSLLGGAVIHAGDLVIDGSVRSKLNKLAHALAG